MSKSIATGSGWKPAPGDTITITIVDFGEHDAGWGRYPILEGETDSGELVNVHAFHDVLRSELARIAAQVGDKITITYLGKHAKGYHLYKVRRAGGAGPRLDWSRYGGDPQPDAPDTGYGKPQEPAGSPDDAGWRQGERGDDEPLPYE
jgi:hypothetical protein